MKWVGRLALTFVAIVLAALSGWLVSQYTGTPKPPQALLPFAGLPLKGTAGSTVRVEDYRGKVVVVVFGCVSCWEMNGSVLGELGRTLSSLGGHADEVQVLVVSVAPERDTAASVVARVTASDPSFVGLMGSPEVIRHLAAIGLTPDEPDAAPPDAAPPDAAPVVVLDQRGHLRLAFPFQISAPSLAEDLSALLRPMPS